MPPHHADDEEPATSPVGRHAGSRTAEGSAQPAAHHDRDGPGQVLRDRAADGALRRDGFVVIDLPEAVGAATGLEDFYGREHGMEGDGFEPDLVNPDLAYRQRVSDRLSMAFDEIVSERFVDHEPFLRVFLAKWPGPQSDLYLHRDWMYIDERTQGHTYVVWIPLCDVDGHNGPLQVLPSSHLIDDSPRGTNLNAPWINHHDVVVPRLRTVTARLGQAVVLDNALVHSSLPNGSGDLRLVAAVGMRPRRAPLVHFFRAGDETAWRFDVDESFFLTTTPQGLLAAPPDLPVVEHLAAGQQFWSEAELLEALGEPTTIPMSPGQPTADPVPDGQTAPATRWHRLARRFRRGRPPG